MRISHILLDLWLADAELLKTVEPIASIVQRAVELSGATIIHSHFHQFEPYGFSGIILIAESHVSVHAWVERNLLAVDILSCANMDGEAIVRHLRKHLEPVKEELRDVTRGGEQA
jgi:S-adenosylmethionine decarboxylase